MVSWTIMGTSLVVQQLRHWAPHEGARGSTPGQGIRSHMLQLKILCAETKIKGPMDHN